LAYIQASSALLNLEFLANIFSLSRIGKVVALL